MEWINMSEGMPPVGSRVALMLNGGGYNYLSGVIDKVINIGDDYNDFESASESDVSMYLIIEMPED